MKILLITQRSDKDSKTGEIRDALDENWHRFLRECGCIGIPVPNNLNTLNEMLGRVEFEGIVLSGGNTPVKYGGDCQERDAVDNALISYSIEHNIPLIGVCRGLQSICLHFNGTLKQVSNHVRVHHKIHGTINGTVNSYHGWAPDYPGDGIIVLSCSEDNQIEMIRHAESSIQGIMWHPEREIPFSSRDINIFKEHFEVNQ